MVGPFMKAKSQHRTVDDRGAPMKAMIPLVGTLKEFPNLPPSPFRPYDTESKQCIQQANPITGRRTQYR